MFDHQRINHLALPSVLLNERSRLPKVSGIYFAATDSEGVLYIGQSVNIRQRWVNHERRYQLSKIKNVHLYWLEVADRSLLKVIEEALIEKFSPPLNWTRPEYQLGVPLRLLGMQTPMRRLRQDAGLRAEAVATTLGVSYSTVRNWEQGRTIPTLYIFRTQKLTQMYKCSLDELASAVQETQNKAIAS
ncbi:MAG: helix-turn-helix domain-containing protein [Nostoc sp.]